MNCGIATCLNRAIDMAELPSAGLRPCRPLPYSLLRRGLVFDLNRPKPHLLLHAGLNRRFLDVPQSFCAYDLFFQKRAQVGVTKSAKIVDKFYSPYLGFSSDFHRLLKNLLCGLKPTGNMPSLLITTNHSV